ncbi:MAG TPA: glycosyltransferase [Puia sp.]|nr:glycosyltransferase [Puia sp.]
MRKYEKSLVILTPGFPKNEADTTCIPFLQDFILELNEQFPNLKIDILAFDYPLNSGTYSWNKNEVVSFNGWKKGNIKRLYKWLLIWRRMKKIRSSQNLIGLLSLWCGECAFLGNLFAKRNHLAHFCWIQGQDAKIENKYIARIKPLPAELIAISDFNQKEFEKNHTIRPRHVIPAGIKPPELFGGNEIRDIDILGVGSFIPLKQYHLFIEIIYKIRQFFPEVKAVLSGKGPEQERLKMAIVNYKVEGNIDFTGELSHDKILNEMKRGKVFLHTSNYEGFSVACMEALGSGCHVISFTKPMQYDIKHWHVVQTISEMLETAKSILNNPDSVYEPVLPFTTRETAKSILQLYNYSDSNIS